MKLTISQMMMLGAFGTVIIVFLSMMNWRRAVHAALIVALLEGAIRKWVFPQGSELVYFFKDIILLGAYLKFYMFPDPDIRAWRLRIPGTFIACVCITLTVFGAVNLNIGSVILALYGLKIYLWYVPLAFMMPLLFRDEQQMTVLLFRYSLFAIPIGLLGVAQFFAGPDSPINTYASSDLGGVKEVATFGVGYGRARITGTFSYIGGHNVFVLVFFIISICLLTAMEGKRRLVLLFANLPLLLANALMTGSRMAVFSLLVVGLLIGMTSAVSRLGKSKNSFFYLIMGFAVASAGVGVFFKKAFDAFEVRRKTAGDTVQGRAYLHHFAAIEAAAKEVDLMGFGIGTSHPAALGIRRALKIAPIKKECPYYDNEIGQCLAELGWPAFIMWYAFRLLMLVQCWGAFSRSPPSIFRSLALGFFCYHLLQLTNQMVLNHTANVFLCATWGFCLIPRLENLVRRPRHLQAPQHRQRLVRGGRQQQPVLRG